MDTPIRTHRIAAFAPILLVILVAVGCVPHPPNYNPGGGTNSVKPPTFTRTLGIGRANNPAVVRHLQDKLNVLSARWGRSGRALPGRSGAGKYDASTVWVVVWARQSLNRKRLANPFSDTGSPLLGKYGYDLIVGAANAAVPAATPRPPAPTPPRPTPPAPTNSRKPVVPANGALLGTWIAPRGTDWTQATQQSLWNQRKAAAGRNYDIAHNFYPFTSPFPTWREPWNISQGRIPMVSWNGTYTDQILSGRYDAMIRQRADALRDLRSPTFLRFYWEMDGNKKDKWANTPADFIAAWKHVHNIFNAEGASNVAWVWCPNAWAFDVNAQNAAQWYPGDASVDWICADGYNWARPGSTAKSVSFEGTFKNFYKWAATKNKPLMIGEFGAIENAPGQKALWINQARVTLKTAFPKVKAIVYYDEYRHEDNTVYDWRLDSSSSSYTAWNNLARDPYFNKR